MHRPYSEIIAEAADQFPEAHSLLERHRDIAGQVVTLDGMTLEVSPHVLSPAITSTSAFFLRCLRQVITAGSVFEVGIGSGYILAGLGRHVPGLRLAGSDINRAAVRLAERNLKANKVHAQLRHGDLFGGLPPGRRFDAVIFNPPLLHARPATDLELAVYDPEGGTFRRFLEELPGRLADLGRAYVLYSDRRFAGYSAEDFLIEQTDRLAIARSRVARLDRAYESYTVWQLSA